jgi:2-isopropylmalate synthase
VQTVEYCNHIKVHPRHPYAGELVFTAFSGSHQDAIRKGFAVQEQRNDGIWDMPYLPIDPADLGESYEAVIRVNSQSGKGGIAWVLEQTHGLKLPRRFQIDFSRKIQDITDASSRELSSAEIWDAFQTSYHLNGEQKYGLIEYEQTGPVRSGASRTFVGRISHDGVEASVVGHGNGLISSAVKALNDRYGLDLDVVDYAEHALKQGSDGQAAAYVEVRTSDDRHVFGVGIDDDVATASVKAVLSAANAL